MSKQKTHTKADGSEARVLEPVADAPQANPAAAAKAPAKKNQVIKLTLLDGAGAVTTDVTAAHVLSFSARGETHSIDMTKIPPAMLRTAALFGLSTTIRNAFNSTEHGGGNGNLAMSNRIRAISGGIWRAQADGSDDGIPLVIEAMIRAKKDQGLYVQDMEDKWLETYRGLDKAAKAEWTKTMSAKKPIALALLQIKAERAAEKANAAARQGAEGEDDSF